MPRRSTLNAITVYVTDDEMKTLKKAATLDNRSVSNFLLTRGKEFWAQQQSEQSKFSAPLKRKTAGR